MGWASDEHTSYVFDNLQFDLYSEFIFGYLHALHKSEIYTEPYLFCGNSSIVYLVIRFCNGNISA